MGRTSELERVLADAGGADAPREWSARLSELLGAELERGARELREPRTGYHDPIVAALAAADRAVLALPLPVELGADPDGAGQRHVSLNRRRSGEIRRLIDEGGPYG